MRGIFQSLVTVNEAVELVRKNADGSEAVFAQEVYDKFLEACNTEPCLIKEFACAAVFEAGRIQGIREERKKTQRR